MMKITHDETYHKLLETIIASKMAFKTSIPSAIDLIAIDFMMNECRIALSNSLTDKIINNR